MSSGCFSPSEPARTTGWLWRRFDSADHSNNSTWSNCTGIPSAVSCMLVQSPCILVRSRHPIVHSHVVQTGSEELNHHKLMRNVVFLCFFVFFLFPLARKVTAGGTKKPPNRFLRFSKALRPSFLRILKTYLHPQKTAAELANIQVRINNSVRG